MKSLILLAENPLGSENQKEKISMANTRVAKGRAPLRGPRVKLSMDERIDRMEKSVGLLAKSVRSLAKGMYSADEFGEEDPMMSEDPLGGYDENEDPMAVDGIDGADEDELELSEDFLGDFDPYGGTEDHGEPDGEEDTYQDEPEDIPGVSHEGDLTKGRVNRARTNKGRINRSRLSKDDASGNFGEKDDDIPGNRRLVPDDKNKDAGEYLIQGGPSDGQGVNKAQIDRMVDQRVRSALVKAGVIRKSDGPAPGANTKLEKSASVDHNQLFEDLKKRSWKEINQLRIELGDLPAGIL